MEINGVTIPVSIKDESDKYPTTELITGINIGDNNGENFMLFFDNFSEWKQVTDDLVNDLVCFKTGFGDREVVFRNQQRILSIRTRCITEVDAYAVYN